MARIGLLVLAFGLATLSGCVDYHIAREERVEEADRTERQTGLMLEVFPRSDGSTLLQMGLRRTFEGTVRKTKQHTRDLVFTTDSWLSELEDDDLILFPFALAWDVAAFGLTAPITYPLGWLAWLTEPDAPAAETWDEELSRFEPVPPGARVVVGTEDGRALEELLWTSEADLLTGDLMKMAWSNLERGLVGLRTTYWEADRPQFKATIELFPDLESQLEAVRKSLVNLDRSQQIGVWTELERRCPPNGAQVRAGLRAELRRLGVPVGG